MLSADGRPWLAYLDLPARFLGRSWATLDSASTSSRNARVRMPRMILSGPCVGLTPERTISVNKSTS